MMRLSASPFRYNRVFQTGIGDQSPEMCVVEASFDSRERRSLPGGRPGNLSEEQNVQSVWRVIRGTRERSLRGGGARPVDRAAL